MADNVTTPLVASTKFKTKDTGANGHLPGHVLYDEAEAEVIGKVTASPTANTVLGRLKDILTLTVLAAGSAIIGKVGIDQTTPGTTNLVSNTPLTNFGAGEYETVAASATAQALGATGATGDYLSGILVVPASTSPGSVTLYDGSSSPDVGITLFTGGATSVSNLVPFFIPLGMISRTGAWKVTTGSSVSCIGIGNFT